MKELVKKIIYNIVGKPQLVSSGAYVDYLRKKGIRIGDGTIVFNVKHINIDVTRPELLEIGRNVFLHKGTTILTHDWASWVFVNRFNEFIPSHGKVKIGDNVWLGENVTILKNVEIGNNVIIGAGSVVTKDIPDNSVAVGVPAKVICSVDSYFKKREGQYVDEAIEYALSIYASGRTPEIEDFSDDYPAFVDCRNYQDYNYPYSKIFTEAQFEQWKKYHHAPFFGYDEFMKEVNRRRNAK